jgi:fibronectin type 3 domain-containing protein
VSSAAWNGSGFSLTGITFPVTVPPGQSMPFTVTFAPQISGSATGQVSFVSDASNSPTVVTLAGSGTQAAQHSVSLSWNASTSLPLGYNVYRGTNSGGPYTKLNSSLISGLSFADNNVQSGATYYYVATSVDSSNLESGYSNLATAIIP